MDLDFNDALGGGAPGGFDTALHLEGFAEGAGAPFHNAPAVDQLYDEAVAVAPAPGPEPHEEKTKRKRRRAQWQQDREAKARWDLLRRVADVSSEVDLVAREVTLLREEMHVPLPPLSALPEAERAALRHAHSRRQAEVLGVYCKKTLAATTAHKWSWPFNLPVDLKMYPDYLDTVTQPVDFGTIKRRLDGGHYAHADEFLADVRRVFDNARAYNKPGSDVHVMATTLQEKFEEKYAAVVARRVAQEAEITAREEEAARRRFAGAGAAGAAHGAEARCAALARYCEEVAARVGDAKSAAAALCAPLSRGEKAGVCAALGRLPQAQFETAVGLVMHHHPGLQPFDDVAFDLALLDALTLRQLQSFVAAVERAEEERRSGGGGSRGKAGSVQVAWPALPLGAGLPLLSKHGGHVRGAAAAAGRAARSAAVAAAGEADPPAHTTPAGALLEMVTPSTAPLQGLRGGAALPAPAAQSANVVDALPMAPPVSAPLHAAPPSISATAASPSTQRQQQRQRLQQQQSAQRQLQAQQVQQRQHALPGDRFKVCASCGTTSTPLWRKQRATGLLMCNACGIKASKRDQL